MKFTLISLIKMQKRTIFSTKKSENTYIYIYISKMQSFSIRIDQTLTLT